MDYKEQIKSPKWFCVTDYTNIIPEKPGVYAIYILNLNTKYKKLVYIGMAQNLYKRLQKHEVKKLLYNLIDYPNCIWIKCKIELNTNKRILLEKELIKKLKPQYNYGTR